MLDLSSYLAVWPSLTAARHTIRVIQKKALLRVAIDYNEMPPHSEIPRPHGTDDKLPLV